MSAKGSVKLDSVMHLLTLRTSPAQWCTISPCHMAAEPIKDPMFDFEGFSGGKRHSVGKNFPFLKCAGSV